MTDVDREISTPPSIAGPDSIASFAEHRGLLEAVAYRVLGSMVDAQDVVQDAWLRWSGVDPAGILDPEGYLVRITTRLAIDQLRSARARREAYVGPWLPEPIRTTPDVADRVELADSVSTAVLLVLEALTPIERAVFVLREAFGYSYAEIAEFVDRQEPAVRQIAHRARNAVAARRRRYDTDIETRRVATERFLAACVGGDLEALMAVLAPGVTMISDGGGRTYAPRMPIIGREAVARAILKLTRQAPEGTRPFIAPLNGGPGIVLTASGPVLAATLHLRDGVIEMLHVVSNPAKLTHVRH
ncbi:RNA polymerase sigma factor SigJ [Microbacterium sp. LWH12-1.2]|uniref:RNA polymerase sigma factor SigJ n=1 Tax=Microbacterium sp. LWH12-1.2 TaxID=3135259 RepID=UPI0034494EA0